MIAGLIAGLLPAGNLKRRFEEVERINRLRIAEAGAADDGVPYIRLTDGPIFYGYPPSPIHKLIYYLLASSSFRKEVPLRAYRVAWDILHRYLEGGQCNQQADYALKLGDRVIEAGAFIGYYTLRMVEDVGPEGHVVSIEPVEANLDIIRRNLQANNVRNVTVVPYAVSDERGVKTLHVTRWQKNSLVREIIRGKGDVREVRVTAETIDNIVEETGIGLPALVILTVNGVEVEALEGMTETLERENVHLVVAAKYVVDGKPVLDRVVDILGSQGYEVKLDRRGFVKNEDPQRQAVVYAQKRSH
jgi:FkbM family methyltransferase